MKQGDLYSAFEPDDGRDAASAVEGARRAPGRPIDGDARVLAVTEFSRPILLSAGAGTGKTATLVARVLHWCLGPGWTEVDDAGRGPEDTAVRVLSGVAAITFTEAAAAEMSTRLGQALARIQRHAAQRLSGAGEDPGLPVGLVADELPANPDVLHERARALRAALDHLDASTIHAFCRRLLAAHPLEVGLPPSFEVDASFSRLEVCVRDVLEEYLESAWEEPVDEDLIALARHGIAPPEIEAAVIDVLDGGGRSEHFAESPLDDATCAGLMGGLRAALEPVLDPIAKLGGAGGNSALAAEGVADTAGVLAALDGQGREAVVELSTSLGEVWRDSRRFDRLKKWGKGDFNKRETKLVEGTPEALGASVADLRHALEPLLELDLEVLEPARRVMAVVLGAVESEMRRRGFATFNDLLTFARRLLVEHPEIAARERRRLRLLLVDEFQDTDALQCDIVRAIGLEGEPAARPSLFLVGDPKQSIFAWRNADLAAFEAFAEAIVSADGLRLELSANFRSRGEILDEVERVMVPVMREERHVQPAFSRLEAGREDARAPKEGPTVEYWVSWPLDESGAVVTTIGNSVGKSYEVEAAALAADVRRRHDEGTPWRDFAVVFRSFTDVEPYLQRLREAGVPYEVQSDRNYFKRREVIDATALVRAVVDPYDQIAFLTLLRSPMVGVPDAAVLPLWEEGLPGDVAWLGGPDGERLEKLAALVRRVAERLPADAVPGLAELGAWEESLLAALDALAHARRDFRTLPTDRFVDALRARFLPDAVEAARFLGSYRLANLDRFFRELERSLEERSGDVLSIVRTLRANLAREDRSEGSRPSDSCQDAVRILTIHGSKGLEFPHVYLAQTHKLGRGGSGPRNAFDARGETPAYALFGSKNPAWFATGRLRDQAEAAERVRLLYVALTRAAERLVVMGGFPPDPKYKLPERATTMVDLLEHRPETASSIQALAARAASGDLEPFVDGSGAEWRLALALGASLVTGDADAEPVETATLASEATIHRDSRALAEAREASRRRSARPFSRAASAESHVETSELRAGGRFSETGEPASGEPIGRNAAQAAGTAVHRVLEGFDTAADREQELARWRAGVEPIARRLAGEPHGADAVARARQILERLADNGLFDRLAAVEVVARELPVLLPVDDDVSGGGDDAPVGFVSGAVDLVYRDPQTGELVVADYKTDAVEPGAGLEERVLRYQAQGRVYTEAVREALALDAPPRFELWFLATGEVR